MGDRLREGRQAFARRAWAHAYRDLAGVAPERLEPADLERLAVAAYLVGADEESATGWEAAHRRRSAAGDPEGAARCCFWLALGLILRGRMAQAGGWLGRAARIVESAGLDGAAAGYLLIPDLLGALEGGEPTTARDLAGRAVETAGRFDDPDLRAFGVLGQGQALIALGDTSAGLAKLDEVMVSVTADEVGPITSGIVYCAVILECLRLFDLSRASEWTEALSAWCERQPDLVPYRGQCLVHRSQLQQVAGDWTSAIETVESACRRLADPPHPALGLAHYQQAELHRLVGAFDRAEAEYRRANHHGQQPMPGLALLALARGDADTAAVGIRRALHETDEPTERTRLLAAAVDVFRATGDLDDARAAADELADLATTLPSEVLGAMTDQATGTVLLGEGDPAGALPRLRAAADTWQRLNMPYEAARTAVLRGLSCAALGDRTSARLELESAHDTFTGLGAEPDLDRLRSLIAGLAAPAAPQPDADARTSLSAREREVLAHVAAGRTNREIASHLLISQHTVGRHLENIFAKLGVGSRAAATAHAYDHGLL